MTAEDAAGQGAPTKDSVKKLAKGRQGKLDAGRRAYIVRVLEGISPTNRPDVERFLREKEASGLAMTSLRNLAVNLAALDQATNGLPFRQASREGLSQAMGAMARMRSPATVNGWAACIRGFLRWLHDDEAPKGLLKGLKRKHEQTYRDVAPITDDELRGLLAAAGDTVARKSALESQAIIMTLWDSGFRISELTSLRVMDFQPDGKGGARLRLRQEEADLKTGARTVYVVDCVPAITAWLSLHPNGGDTAAPLFPSRIGGFSQALLPRNVNQMLDRLTARAGMRAINPHLFRHTRATRAARMGWNEPQMRAYFGWSRDSEMPGHYIHLAERDMEERVRRDAGIDGLGIKERIVMDHKAIPILGLPAHHEGMGRSHCNCNPKPTPGRLQRGKAGNNASGLHGDAHDSGRNRAHNWLGWAARHPGPRWHHREGLPDFNLNFRRPWRPTDLR